MSEIQKGAEIKKTKHMHHRKPKSRTVAGSNADYFWRAVFHFRCCLKRPKLFVQRKVWCWWVNDEWLNTVFCTLRTATCHSSIPLTPFFVIQIQQPAPALLPCPLRPVSAFICASQVTKRPSQWINIKILFRGIRLGNILPSNAALARAKARQGINY